MAELRLAESFLAGRESARRGFLDMRRYQMQRATQQRQSILDERQFERQSQLDVMGRERFSLEKGLLQQRLAAGRAKFEREGAYDALMQLMAGDREGALQTYNSSGENRVSDATYDQNTGIATLTDTQGRTTGINARQFLESAGKLQKPRYGTEVPFPEDVEEQKIRMERGKKGITEETVGLDLARKGLDIEKLKSDTALKKQQLKINALRAEQGRTTSILQQRKLSFEIDEREKKANSALREKAADLGSSRATIDNMLNTAQRVLDTPLDVIEDATGPISTKLMTLSQDTADFEELVTTLSSQAFLAQIPLMKGTGALSDAEGKKLETGLQSLSLRQSPKRLKENLNEITRLLMKGRKNLADKYGVEETIPDVPAVQTFGTVPKQSRNIVVDY